MQTIESILILIALFSLMPLLWDYSPVWYRIWLALVLVSMVWVSGRRLRRMREALDEQRRKRDGGGRPPRTH